MRFTNRSACMELDWSPRVGQAGWPAKVTKCTGNRAAANLTQELLLLMMLLLVVVLLLLLLLLLLHCGDW